MGEEAMQIDFDDVSVQEAAQGADPETSGWSRAESAHLRLLTQCLDASEVVDDVLSMRCLLVKPETSGVGSYTASLSAVRQVRLKFEHRGQDLTAIVGVGSAELEAKQ